MPADNPAGDSAATPGCAAASVPHRLTIDEWPAGTPLPEDGSPGLPAALRAHHRSVLPQPGRRGPRPRVRGLSRPRPALDVPRVRRAHRRARQGPARHRHEAGRPSGRVGAQHPRLAHLHVRHRQDRRGHGHGEPGVQEPRARLRAQAVRHEGALRHRRVSATSTTSRNHLRPGARGPHPGARPPRDRELPLPQEPHLHGSREASRVLQRARTASCSAITRPTTWLREAEAELRPTTMS